MSQCAPCPNVPPSPLLLPSFSGIFSIKLYLLCGNDFTNISHISDSKATNLLPLAHEYEIEQLKNICILELEKFANACLEHVTLAIRYSLDDLLNKAIKCCAMKLSVTNIDCQRLQAENHEIDDSIVLQILR